MSRRTSIIMALSVVLLCCGRIVAQSAGTKSAPPNPSPQFLISPPKGSGPVVVRASFILSDVNEINGGE
jgi:hypothetical protein